MNTTDRTQQPQIHNIGTPNMPTFNHTKCANGANIFTLRGGTQPLLKIDFAFGAGTLVAEKSLVARTTSTLIAEGTQKHTSAEMSEILDFYGAYLWQETTYNHSIISILCLKKHFGNILPLIEEMIKTPTFPGEEVAIFREQRRQAFAIDMQNTSFLAKRKIRQMLYAEGSRYGRVLDEADFDNLTTETLAAFHAATYTPDNLSIFISGLPDDTDVQAITDVFGTQIIPTSFTQKSVAPAYRPGGQRQYIECATAQQASISMARPFESINHPDSNKMAIADTIFGGYFGSRLMSNIREKKGLTYGIGSGINFTANAGAMFINSDVRPEKYNLVIDEIFAEMRRLATEPIGNDELTMVKNYMKGDLLRLFDSTITSAETLTRTILKDCKQGFYEDFYNTIETISPDDIMGMAEKYYRPEAFSIAVAGPPKN